MKITEIKIGATIPVVQYGNIMPEITISDVEAKEGIETGISYIKELFGRFSEKGALQEKEYKEVIKVLATKTAFNNQFIVGFDPESHTYSYNGKPLMAVTKYVESLYKKFDSDKMSEVTANAWGVDKNDLSSLWTDNGNLSALFGKVVHEAIEFYHKYKLIGETIQTKKELEANYALPKHPVLKSIIEGYLKIDKFKGVVYPEQLLVHVDSGLAGHADMIRIIDLGKKICRVGDIKININSEEEKKELKPSAPFDSLPANKLTKYQIQMSIYANMLEKSGWTVEGLDAFVYEAKWKHYKLNVLQVI